MYGKFLFCPLQQKFEDRILSLVMIVASSHLGTYFIFMYISVDLHEFTDWSKKLATVLLPFCLSACGRPAEFEIRI